MNKTIGEQLADSQFAKRFKGFLWVVLAGTIATGLELVVQNIGLLQLSPEMQGLLIVVLTAIISQITKYLNSGTNQ